jgi:hypothetical protein
MRMVRRLALYVGLVVVAFILAVAAAFRGARPASSPVSHNGWASGCRAPP